MDETDPLAVLVTAAATDVPALDDLLRQINELGYGTTEYFDCMAFLFITLARSQWRRADQVRARTRQATGVRDPLLAMTATCSGCAQRRAVNRDGTVRKHDGPAGTATCPGSRRPPAT